MSEQVGKHNIRVQVNGSWFEARSKEAPRHVTGGGRFTDDLSFPGLLHAVIVRSPYPHAKIRSVDAAAASAMPGVVAVIGPAEVAAHAKPFKPGRYAAGLRVNILEYATAVEKVRYVGEPVAMVAARTRAQAEDAVEAVVVDYEPLPPGDQHRRRPRPEVRAPL